MKKILLFLLSFFCSSLSAYNATLLFYPSLKYAVMSGGLPAQLECQYDDNKKILNIDEYTYPIEKLDYHTDFCICDCINTKEFQFDYKKMFLLYNGHYYEIKFRD